MMSFIDYDALELIGIESFETIFRIETLISSDDNLGIVGGTLGALFDADGGVGKEFLELMDGLMSQFETVDDHHRSPWSSWV